MLCCMLLGGTDDFLMAEMQPIKRPDRQCHRAGDGGEIFKAVEQCHARSI